MFNGLLLAAAFILVLYHTRKYWLGPVKATFTLAKFQWITSYYLIKGTKRYHMHVLPKSGKHFETEDGDCPCHPGKEEIGNGFVYYHKVSQKSFK